MLQHRNPENLWAKMKETNLEKNLVRRIPSLSQVKDWVRQAKRLPPKVTY